MSADPAGGPRQKYYRSLVDGELVDPGVPFDVTNPYHGGVVGQARFADPATVERAVAVAAAAVPVGRDLPAFARAAALDTVVDALEARSAEFAELITAENGKPITWARGEVARAISTFRWAAEEARRFVGDLQRLDTDPASAGRMALVGRFPRGAVLGIAPFNFPLNLVAHKIAPAIAAGAPILLKPAPKTPLAALLLAEVIAETELPPGLVQVLIVPDEQMDALITDPRLPVVSFTGSERVGRMIQDRAPGKHLTLELGGNAAAVVTAGYADVTGAANRIATFANYQAGQSCVAVQRVLVADEIADDFTAELVAAVEALPTGDPTDPATLVGPVIDDAAADRIMTTVDSAVAAGGRVLTGGTRDGRSIAPTVLVDVPAEHTVASEEIFGPVVVVSRFGSIDEAFAQVNASRFGLQAGVFTTDIKVAFAAHRELEVGGVIIGDVPSFRADQMPYGGWKDSGVGREGVRSAMEDYTDARVLVLTGVL